MDRRLDAIVDELLARRRARRPLAPLARDELKLLVYEARTGVPVEALAADAKRLLARADRFRAAHAATTRAWAGGRGIEREAMRLSYPTWLLEAFVARLRRGRGGWRSPRR